MAALLDPGHDEQCELDSLLRLAATGGALRTTKALLDAGARPTAQAEPGALTALHLAACAGDSHMCRLLLTKKRQEHSQVLALVPFSSVENRRAAMCDSLRVVLESG